MTTQSITSGQKKQYLRFVEDAAERALVESSLDKDGLQRLIENGGEFQADIVSAIKRLSMSDQFTDEEVLSQYVYPKEYKPKSLPEQIATLGKLFDLKGEGTVELIERLPTITLPDGAEGWFAIPRWQSLAPTYNEALQKLLAKIGQSWKFCNYCSGQIGPDRLKQSARSIPFWEKITETQKGDILIIPAQFGLRHRGKSVRRVRKVIQQSEFGLGAFAVGAMLLTHPDREVKPKQLHVDCAGDECDYYPFGGVRWGCALYFRWRGSILEFNTRRTNEPRGHYGSASGFLPA